MLENHNLVAHGNFTINAMGTSDRVSHAKSQGARRLSVSQNFFWNGSLNNGLISPFLSSLIIPLDNYFEASCLHCSAEPDFLISDGKYQD